MKPCGPCSPSEEELPCSLGRYELQEMIGQSMATVYRGWDPVFTCKVAVKTIDLPPEGEAEEELVRFRREAQAAGRLSHPNIVRAYNFGETARVAYIVMEFVEGRSLAAALRARERLASSEALRIVDDVLTALQYSHDHGVIHRDIKPANIIVTPDRRAKVADFGIARIQSGIPMRDLTRVGTPIGTWGQMSPEQAEAQTLDARTDIYSTGLVLYQLLTGARPTEPEGGSGVGVIERGTLDRRIQRRSKLPLATSRRVAAVIERASALRVQDRYASADEFRLALLEAVVPPSPVPALIRSAVLTIVLAAGGSLWMWPWWPWPWPRPDRATVAAEIAPIRCALVSGDIVEGGAAVVLNGVAESEAAARLRAAVAKTAPRAAVDWHVAPFEGPYCDALDLLRSISAAFGVPRTSVAITMDGNRTELYDGDPINVRITAPNYTSMVQLDYLQGGEGSVYHMQQSNSDSDERYAPLSEHSSAEATPGTSAPLTVLPPFGTDMIVAVASDKPLFSQPRPPVERIQDYLRDLGEALIAARHRGENLSGAALVLTTRPRS